MEAKEPKTVRARTVAADLKWLLYVLGWAVNWRLETGGYLMRENPVRGYAIPSEKNPRRPVATADRHEAIRAKPDEHTYQIRSEERVRYARS